MTDALIKLSRMRSAPAAACQSPGRVALFYPRGRRGLPARVQRLALEPFDCGAPPGCLGGCWYGARGLASAALGATTKRDASGRR